MALLHVNLRARAVAALRLYQETVKLLLPILQPDHFSVIERTTQVIDEACSHLELNNALP